tara:strand:- start:425 stop:751 length:327 start_codon:yes stop_codon:yes gene_type:complete
VIEKEKEIETKRQRDRYRDRETEKRRDREREIETGRRRNKETEKQRDRETKRQRNKETEKFISLRVPFIGLPFPKLLRVTAEVIFRHRVDLCLSVAHNGVREKNSLLC